MFFCMLYVTTVIFKFDFIVETADFFISIQSVSEEHFLQLLFGLSQRR